MTSIKNAVVLVTGAGGGLGREFVSQALQRGASKVYAATRTPQEWHDARVVPVILDVTDDAAIEAASRRYDDVSILINNAGILRRGELLTAPLADLRAQMETNLFGPVKMTRALAETIIARSGAIVNIASVLSWLPAGKGYGVSKAALWSATNALRLELAPKGVQVTGVYLAYTDTPMNAGLDLPSQNAPADVVHTILDGVEAGADEVLADEITRRVRTTLSHPVGTAFPHE